MRLSDWDQSTFSFPHNGDEQSSSLVDRFLRSQERDLSSCRSTCPALTMANGCKLPQVLELCVNSPAILPLRDGPLCLRHWKLLSCFWHSRALSWLWLSSLPLYCKLPDRQILVLFTYVSCPQSMIEYCLYMKSQSIKSSENKKVLVLVGW